jgi:ribokinase
MHAVVIGAAVLDLLALVDRLPDTAQPAAGDVAVVPGGAGATMALAAARLEAAVGLITRLGDDSAGAAIADRLRAGGVELLLPPRPGTRTDRRLGHVTPAGECAMTLHRCAGDQVAAVDVAGLSRRTCEAHVVAACADTPMDAVEAALRGGRAAGALTVLRADPPEAWAVELFPLVDVVSVGAPGALAYAGVRPTDRPSAYRAARVLLGRGPRWAVVDVGPAGTLVAWSDGHRWLRFGEAPCPGDPPWASVPVVDRTGAADVLTAVFAVALAEGRAAAEAGAYAAAAAALAMRALGAQEALPRRADIEALLGTAAEPITQAAPEPAGRVRVTELRPRAVAKAAARWGTVRAAAQ